MIIPQMYVSTISCTNLTCRFRNATQKCKINEFKVLNNAVWQKKEKEKKNKRKKRKKEDRPEATASYTNLIVVHIANRY